MLKIAEEKVSHVAYTLQDAEVGLPYTSGFFDYVSNNFAFHQFTKKEFMLDEMARILKNGGILRMRNGTMEKTPGHWLYQYFPTALEIDRERCWPTERLFSGLVKRDFTVRINIDHSYWRERISDIQESTLNKDASHFAMISASEYQSGLDQMRNGLP